MPLPQALRQYEDDANKFVHDTSAWFFKNLKIIDRNNDLIPLTVNAQQIEVLRWVGMQLSARVPVRIIILKARRMGMSTLITALGFFFCIMRQNYPAFACAHETTATETLRTMCKTFQEELPENYQRSTKYDSLKGLVCNPPHRSSYRFHTAGQAGRSGLGRSKEITFLHISEKALIPHFKVVAAGIMACVPKRNPWSCIFKESTANGEEDDGEFHSDWIGTTQQRRDRPDDLSGYIPLFFSWLDFPEYRTTVPQGYQWGETDEWELRLKELGANQEQLYFRRMTLIDDYTGDPEIFAQEYPATPSEAFQTSGRPAIPLNVIQFHEKLCRPGKRMLLHRDGDKVTAYPAPEGTKEYWEVFFEPDELCDYTVGGDVAEGMLSDPTDEKSLPDCHAGAVLNRRYLRVDAVWVGRRMGADAWGQELRSCAQWYNEAWASPEANAAGQAALVAFKSYPRIFQRRPAEPVGTEEKELMEIGYKTTMANRKFMIDMFLSASSPHEEIRTRSGFSDRLKIYSDKVVTQEKTFIVTKTGKREHRPGAFDDLLFAIFIALQLHLQCQRTLVVPEFKVGLPIPLDSRWAGGFAGSEDDDEVTDPYDVGTS